MRNPTSNYISLSPWLVLLCFCSTMACAEPGAFTFDKTSKKLTPQILDELVNNHYQKVSLNDKFSRELLDHIFETLDPDRIIFLESDIREFQQWQLSLDDQLRSADTEAMETILRRHYKRSTGLIRYTLADLGRYQKPYTAHTAVLQIDRKSAPWPKTEAESRDLWDRRIYNEALLIRLSDSGSAGESQEILKKRYESRLKKLETMDSEDAYKLYINTALDLYDPHTEWFTPQEQENFKINMSLTLEGIGAVLQQEEDKTKIARLVTGGPAAKSGAIQAGDYILAVGQGKAGDLEDITGMRLDEVVERVRGPKGSLVRLQIQDVHNQATRLVEIEREKIKLEDQAAKSAVIENVGGKPGLRIGIINVPTFYLDFEAARKGEKDYRSTTRDVEMLLRDLMRKKVDGVVIDLRNNGGGSLQEARLLSNLFISQGPIVQIRSSNDQVDLSWRADQDPVYPGPLLVITNRLSASASEIFAGAIQDYQRGLIFGEQTFGKGTVQTIVDLDIGQLKYTNAKFYRVSGDSTQHRGVVPDISVPSIFDFKEVGESALEHVMPWDQIREINHAHYNEIAPYLTQLTAEHKERMSRDPEYKLLSEKIAFRNARKDQKLISLNEAERQKERAADNAWLLKVTNRMRKSKGLEAFKDIEALEKYEEEKSAEINGATVIRPDDDFVLREAAAILGNFIQIKGGTKDQSLANRK